MKQLNFLHVSDLHACEGGKKEIEHTIDKLCEDLKSLIDEKNLKIDYICFTGDMVKEGGKFSSQFEIAKELFIDKLLKVTQLSDDNFLLVPGNHEVDANINKVDERGLAVDNLGDIKDIWENFDKNYRKRLNSFYEYLEKKNGDIKLNNKLGYSKLTTIGNLSVGFACVDSSWRSSGKGKTEKGTLYLCSDQIDELYNDIKDADVKICMMHHPADWFVSCEQIEIEKKLSQFDIVLNGHVHCELDKYVQRRNAKTIYSTAGKLYPIDKIDGEAIDGFIGYSLINYDCDLGVCTIYLRSYYAKTREAFDMAVNIVQDGMVTYNIGNRTTEQLLWLKYRDELKANIKSKPRDFFNIRVIPDAKMDLLKDLYEPELSTVSNYCHESIDDENTAPVSLSDISTKNTNQLLIGKREIGKSTVLFEIALKLLESEEKLPIIIDMNNLTGNKNRIYLSAYSFVNSVLPKDKAINKAQFTDLLRTEKFVLLIDNYNIDNSNHVLWLEEFTKEYNICKCIIAANESFLYSISKDSLPNVFSSFDISYISYMKKNQIRKYVESNCRNTDSIEYIVDNIDAYCRRTNLEKTPFNIQVLITIGMKELQNLVNEGKMMRKYMDVLLGRISNEEGTRGTFDYDMKEDFLCNLAHFMYENKHSKISETEFFGFISNYLNKLGRDISPSHMSEYFVNSGILVRKGNYIQFSGQSFFEYFMAVYALKDEDIIYKILEDDNLIWHTNIISFYAGLQKDILKLLNVLEEKNVAIILKYLHLVQKLNSIEVITEWNIQSDEFFERIENNRLSLAEIDDVYDKIEDYNANRMVEISEDNIGNNSIPEENEIEINSVCTEDFNNLALYLQIYGCVIRNADFVDIDYRKRHLENYMIGIEILYAMVIQITMDNKGKKFEITKEEICIDDDFIDAIKLSFPTAIQKYVYETVGTPTLKNAIQALDKDIDKNAVFEKFMIIFLMVDLGIIKLDPDLHNYIKQQNNDSILKLINVKLIYYYKFHFFGENKKIDDQLIKLIETIMVKLDKPGKKNLGKDKMRIINHDKVRETIKKGIDDGFEKKTS